MALQSTSMTRSSSTSSSALSNITVTAVHHDDDSSEPVRASTPPTSMEGGTSVNSADAKEGEEKCWDAQNGRRLRRSRSNVSTYNIKKLASQQERAASSRNVSGLTGRTLVGSEELEDGSVTPNYIKTEKAPEEDLESSARSPITRSTGKLQRRTSVKDRVRQVAGKMGSVLGKRRREVVEAGKHRLGISEEQASPKISKVMKELDTGSKGLLDEMDLENEIFSAPAARPAKKAKTPAKSPLQEVLSLAIPTATPLRTSGGKGQKKWQKEGLYVGQDPKANPAQVGGGARKLQKKRPDSSGSDGTAPVDVGPAQRAFMTLPMFNYLDKTRDFVIPYDIYAPLAKKKGEEKPKDWIKLNRNRLVGEAKEFWEKAERLPVSVCVCAPPPLGQQGCEDDCLNRVMQYECNDDNCYLSAEQCSNRAFTELAARTKKGGAFDLGVEVIKTDSRGFGVRSSRSFAPGQIIMEYTGEIISEGESQRRMREDYKDKQCYYLMELERGLIIDGTRGSMARFINHSCSPNCEVRMTKVNGIPRMAVFAGEAGVVTGEELSYDYNFDNFGATQQKCYCGAASCRGTLSKRLNAAEQKKQAKEDSERKHKAALEAQKQAARELKKKQDMGDRGPTWRGWVAVDDPEILTKLREEKRQREGVEKNSARAQRLAARRTSLPPPTTRENPKGITKASPRRRRTVQVHQTLPRDDSGGEEELIAVQATVTTTIRDDANKRAVSSGSKFTEEFSPNHDVATTVIRQTEISISTSEVATHADAGSTESDGMVGVTFEIDRGVRATKRATGLSRTASKGKGVAKVLGQAFKAGLKGAGSTGGGKLKQTTLSFTKFN